ncbi:MAG: hypothetical protein ACKOX3_09280 [Bacteroidota bacterium]
MKKLFTFILIILPYQALIAQSFQEGNLLLKGGLGISSPYYYSNTEGIMPPLSLNFDYSIKDKIGIGGIVGVAASKFSIVDNKGEYLAKQNYRLVGGRATYHFWSKEHFDVYLGAMMGYVFTNWKVKHTSDFYSHNEIIRPGHPNFVLAGFAGLNYSINDNWGVFGEIGYSLSFVTGGAYWRIPQVK